MFYPRMAAALVRCAKFLTVALFASTGALPAAAQIAGDECSNALPVYNGVNAQVALASFTHSTTLPLPDCGSGWDVSKDVWFRYDAPVEGRVLVELHGSTFDTMLAVYGGECGSLTLLGCDDDDGAVASATSRLIEIPVTKGKVFLRIAGFNGATGTIALRFNYEAAGSVKIWGRSDSPSYPQGSFFNIPAMPTGALAVETSWNSTFAGLEHAIARTPDGGAIWWGNALTNPLAPALATSVIAIACGDYHNILLRDENTPGGISGQVVSWGCGSPNSGGACPNWSYGQATPPAAAASGVRSIAAGQWFSIASKADGSVLTWGYETWSGGSLAVPASASGVSVVGAGSFHALAIKRDGTLLSWGSNSSGQSTVPPNLGPVLSADGGYANTIALRRDRQVVVWGSNTYGQTTIPPAVIANGAVAVSAGSTLTLAALMTNGEVVAWGNNSSLLKPSPAGAFSALDVDYHAVAIWSRDCNGNGIADGLEVNDCDQDGVPDCEEIAVGSIEDCNDNGLADACEKQLTLSLSSGQLGPIGYQQPQTWTIPDAATAVGPVTLKIRGKGDFSSYLEHLEISCGNLFTAIALGATDDCLFNPPWQSFTLTPDQFNSGIGADGAWRLDMVATIAVDPTLCPAGTWVEATVDYVASNSADCNANSLLDSCEIANGWAADANSNGIPDACDTSFNSCPTDVDRDGQTGASDLSGLLLAWGSVNANFDFDGDGSVGASDLSALLLAWGPCAKK